MHSVLTSWKEIARYLGKGVRTVQRWEASFGLPVRRAHGDSCSAVIALTDEIDAWILTRTHPKAEQGATALDVVSLRRRISSLERENALLRQRLIALPGLAGLGEFADGSGIVDDSA